MGAGSQPPVSVLYWSRDAWKSVSAFLMASFTPTPLNATLSSEDRSHKVAGAALWEWDPEKA